MEPIVYPWMAVVVNIAVELRDGLPVGDSSRKLKEWANILCAIVEFTKDWAGFKNAIMFEKAFEMENHGKRDWYAQRDNVDNLYAWIARDEECNSKCFIGKYLRKHANLTTIPENEREEKRRDVKLVCSLNNELEMKDKQREEIKRKISRTETFLWSVTREKVKMVQELQMREQQQCDHLQSISIAHERSKSQLEAEREELRLFEKGLKEREAFNGGKKMKLDHLKKMGLKDWSAANVSIGVKRMGDLDKKPFHVAAKREYPAEEAREKAMELASLDYNLRALSWHPFKFIMILGLHKEIIDEEDDKIKTLKNECGDEAYEAVITAPTELNRTNRYNPSGRYPVRELWDNKEGRKVTQRAYNSY